MRTGEALERGLGPEERRRLTEGLLRLLKEQAERYTGGGSSSIPVETARELMDSICFCLGLGEDGSGAGVLLDRGIEVSFREGLGRIEKKLAWGQKLWSAVRDHMPQVESRSMEDTIRSIGVFWRRYDPRLFAHQIPCDIDYQLAIPVPESRRGVDYVNAYLTRLAVENQFLNRFSGAAEKVLLKCWCPGYRELLVNLFEPVFAVALGLVLLGREPGPLTLGKEDLGELAELFRDGSRRGLDDLLCGAADRLAVRLEFNGRESREYLRACAAELTPRIATARDVGGLEGIFPPVDGARPGR